MRQPNSECVSSYQSAPRHAAAHRGGGAHDPGQTWRRHQRCFLPGSNASSCAHRRRMPRTSTRRRATCRKGPPRPPLPVVGCVAPLAPTACWIPATLLGRTGHSDSTARATRRAPVQERGRGPITRSTTRCGGRPGDVSWPKKRTRRENGARGGGASISRGEEEEARAHRKAVGGSRHWQCQVLDGRSGGTGTTGGGRGLGEFNIGGGEKWEIFWWI